MARPDLTTLPIWAQQEITRLQREVTDWQAKAQAGPDGSDTFRHDYGDAGRDSGTPLGHGPTIRFEVDPTIKFHVTLADDGALDISATGTDGAAGELHIVPRATNRIRVHLIRRP